jgi:hypothetical protein
MGFFGINGRLILFRYGMNNFRWGWTGCSFRGLVGKVGEWEEVGSF